jgi:hypothetical protein
MGIASLHPSYTISRRAIYLNDFKLIWVVQSSLKKYFA